MKFGKEVEGRFRGLYLLLCTAEEARALGRPKTNLYLTERHPWELRKTQAVYISDHENTIQPEDDCLIEIGKDNLPIIIEVKSLSIPARHYGDNVSFFLRVEGKSFWNLRTTDQVKFSKDQVVYTMTLNNMGVTLPEEFRDDVIVEGSTNVE